MNSQSDGELLRDYAERRSEAAFAELVRRHIDLVYSAALRMCRSPSIAEDVTQSVFMALAQSPGRLVARPALSGWLHRTTQNLAANAVRAEVRRRAREQQAAAMTEPSPSADPAWEQLAPHLDDAIRELNDQDRDAVLLRYFQRKSAREIAATLGLNEEVAQKRVERAVVRLKGLLETRGVTISSTLILAALATHSVQAAPAGLAAAACSAALAHATATTGLTVTFFKFMAMTKLKATLVSAIALATITTPLAFQYHAQARLRGENDSLRQQLNQQVKLAAENERLSTLIEQSARTNSQLLPGAELNELLRLRGEVSRLRSESRELARLKNAETQNPVARLRQELAQMPERDIPELRSLKEDKWAQDAARGKLDTEEGVRETLGNLRRAAKIRFAFALGQALNKYIKTANGQLPNDVSDLKPFFDPPADDAALQRYQMLHAGKLSDLAPEEPVIAEKAAVDDQFDTLFKIGANSYIMEGVGRWSHLGFTNKW